MKALGFWLAMAFSFGLGMVASAALDEQRAPRPDYWKPQTEWERFKAAAER